MKLVERHEIRIDLKDGNGWNLTKLDPGEICYLKGYILGLDDGQAAKKLLQITDDDQDQASEQLENLNGCFACVIERPDRIDLVVDKVRSIPLLLRATSSRTVISDHFDDTRETIEIDQFAALQIAMSGYTIGQRTLDRNTLAPCAGETLRIDKRKLSFETHQYYSYRPWLRKTLNHSKTDLVEELYQTTIQIIESLAEVANGRQILIPLSAGLDSRLLVSFLQKVKYDNIRTFSYGLKDNFEAKVAREVAATLKIPWEFWSIGDKDYRKLRASNEFEVFFKYADNLTGTPSEQDVVPMIYGMRHHLFDREAICVNGQSGDFITGGHIPDSLVFTEIPVHGQDDLFREFLAKHFSLWPFLSSNKHKGQIISSLIQQLGDQKPRLDDPSALFGIYEHLEFINRQSKYTLSNQRSYEHIGLSWMLPLWDSRYLNFWEGIPLQFKLKQDLFKHMLTITDVGGVWRSNMPARPTIRPKWIIPLRFIAKAMFCVVGKEEWHRFERRVFNYPLDISRNYLATDYHKVLFGPDHRNNVSWLTAQYLAHK
ncbi:asparagine synthase C-terminal domain-containing protein, partial [Litorivicinus sp.]|nr:asparagine synthase C-terminal domain-containing protein [Litorivicinus sp.]